MEKLISFDLKADFGFFKKPDVNDGLQLSYNMLHKPALLGILGAIAGLKGYTELGKLPEYYERLAPGLLIGLAPLQDYHERGNFGRTVIAYTNTVGYANEDGGTHIIYEHTLIKPAYRCYLLLDTTYNADHAQLYQQITSHSAVFVPYFGKNEFQLWWENVQEYEWDRFEAKDNFRIDSLFIRSYPLKAERVKPDIDFETNVVVNASSFAYFERLPWRFLQEPKMIQYELAEFAYTDWVLKASSRVEQLFALNTTNTSVSSIIQLF